jgi:dsRNA-specific ribonuclease
VISYDPPHNLVFFVQRRGRARHENSTNILFLLKNDARANIYDWAVLEAEMVRMYLEANIEQFDELDRQDSCLQKDSYRVPATGALLTHENAQAHLNHFCQVGISHVSNNIDMRPEYTTERDPSTRLWTATVTLLSFVHPNLRSAQSEQSWHAERCAIYDAAFQIYVHLHENGLVNDNLLPLFRDQRPEEGQILVDQSSIIEVSERRSVWKPACDAMSKPDALWMSSIVEIFGSEGLLLTMDMWTPGQRPSIGTFSLYWDDKTTYTVTIRASNHELPDDCTVLTTAREITRLLLRAVYGDKVLSDRIDFPAIFAPSSCDDLEAWLIQRQRDPQQLEVERLQQNADYGLLRSRRTTERKFILLGIVDTPHDTEIQIEASVFPRRRDFLHAVANLDAIPTDRAVKHVLSASDCTMDALEAKYSQFAAFIPCIMHRVDVNFLVHELMSTKLSDLALGELSLVLEAICSPMAREELDYNRLEYLGDCLLKHSVELQLLAQNRSWPEKYLTQQKDRVVCNTNLSEAALTAQLETFILTKNFTANKWRPIYASEVLSDATDVKRQMSTKVLADVVEALIGASYVEGGLSKAHACVELLLPKETWWPMDRCFSALVEGLVPCDITDLRPLERLIGHEFKHPTLLVEATTHVSFEGNHTGMSYERLEYIGDSVLDIIITPKLFAHSSKLRHWQLHGVHEALMNSHFLGFCCLRYAIEDEIFVVVQDTDSLGIPTPTLQPSKRQLHLYDFVRAAPVFTKYRTDAVTAFKTLRQPIEDALYHGDEYPWCDLVALYPHKYLCDIVESILGALYIDTGGDLTVCEAFVQRLGILEIMDHILDHRVRTLSPKERMGVVADQGKVKYLTGVNEDKVSYTCTVTVDDVEVYTVDGCANKVEAEVKAAYHAVKILESRDEDPNHRRRRQNKTEDMAPQAQHDV